jgi:hypothetical protein
LVCWHLRSPFSLVVFGAALWSPIFRAPCSPLVRSRDGASAVAGVELPRREGVAAQYLGSATTLPACQAKIRPDVPMGMGRGPRV